jgi:hypothetical protein
MTRRKWRASHGVELDRFKSLEQAFEAYVGQLQAVENAIAKSIADGDPKSYRLPKVDELEKTLSVLNGT